MQLVNPKHRRLCPSFGAFPTVLHTLLCAYCLSYCRQVTDTEDAASWSGRLADTLYLQLRPFSGSFWWCSDDVANPAVQPCSAETLLLWTYWDLGSKMRKTNQTIPFACGLSELSIGINRELDFYSSCQLSWGWGLHTSGVLLQWVVAKQCGSSSTWDVHPGAIFIGLSLGLVFDWHWWSLIFKWDILGLWKREILWYDGLILDHGPCWIWISP